MLRTLLLAVTLLAAPLAVSAQTVINDIRLVKYNTTADVAAVGTCNNAGDLAVFKTDYTTFHATLQSCASSCLGAGACSATCLTGKTGLTADCATCFGNDVSCTDSNCFSKCAFSPSSADCTACSNQYCKPALLTCTAVDASLIPN